MHTNSDAAVAGHTVFEDFVSWRLLYAFVVGIIGVLLNRTFSLFIGSNLQTGTVYSLGRADYGMLGLGKGVGEKNSPTAVPGLPKSTSVACGERVGYSMTEDGEPEQIWRTERWSCSLHENFCLLSSHCNNT